MMPVTADMGGVAPRLDGRTLDDSDTASDRKFVAALARGLEVLRAFKPSDGYLGNREIAERTRLSKPTVTRLTYTLTRLGYLAHDDQLGKYQLAPGAISIGYAALARLGVRHMARPFMQEMANETGASVALGARDRSSVIYVELCRGRTGLTAALDPGSRLPIATTATFSPSARGRLWASAGRRSAVYRGSPSRSREDCSCWSVSRYSRASTNGLKRACSTTPPTGTSFSPRAFSARFARRRPIPVPYARPSFSRKNFL
jgi:hypothetical protein